jgi:hypothetical protein
VRLHWNIIQRKIKKILVRRKITAVSSIALIPFKVLRRKEEIEASGDRTLQMILIAGG